MCVLSRVAFPRGFWNLDRSCPRPICPSLRSSTNADRKHQSHGCCALFLFSWLNFTSLDSPRGAHMCISGTHMDQFLVGKSTTRIHVGHLRASTPSPFPPPPHFSESFGGCHSPVVVCLFLSLSALVCCAHHTPLQKKTDERTHRRR